MIASRRSFAVFALTTLALLAAAAADAQSSTLKAIPLTLRRVATVNLAQVAAQGARNNTARPLTTPIDPSLYATAVNRRIPRASLSSAAGADALIRAAALAPPEAINVPFAPSSATTISGFNGLNALDSWIGHGNSPIEPPDQGLCVGNNTVIEMTNLEFREFSTTGTPLGPAINLATVFGVPSMDFLS
ncbi:MAG: hypothetical protein QOG61_2343, partial [Candidatus Binataceae bacterium]|nr:hypothetical protein [Candidatus Binataceae bacterium]